MENTDLQKAVEQMARGEEAGFNKVYSAACNKVYFWARQITKNEQDAEDLVQIVFVEAYKNIGSLQSPKALFAWLNEITYRQGAKMYRKRSEVLLDEEGQGMFDIIESEDISVMPELTADQQATCEIIMGIIEELPELQKAAVTAFYYDNKKVEEIARMMECSTGTIKSRLNYARKYIKERIEEKERTEGYRLHTEGLPVLWLALRLLSKKYAITAGFAQKIYLAVCQELGIQAAESVTLENTEAKVQAESQPGVSEGQPASGKAAAASAKTIRIAGLLVATVVTVGGLVYMMNQKGEDTPAQQEQTEIAETAQMPEEPKEPGEITEDLEEEPVQASEEEQEEDLTWAREMYDNLLADNFDPVMEAILDIEDIAAKCQNYQLTLEEWMPSYYKEEYLPEEGPGNAYRISVSDTECLGVVIGENGVTAFVGGSDGKEGFQYLGVGDKFVRWQEEDPAMVWDMSYETFDGTTLHRDFDVYKGEDYEEYDYPDMSGNVVPLEWFLTEEELDMILSYTVQ